MERVVGKAIVADTYEQGRALLTNTAMNYVGALSALEQRLVQVDPLGEARYKHIDDVRLSSRSLSAAELAAMLEEEAK